MITRKSSDLLAVTHKGVANSLRFIWQHYHEPIQVNDVPFYWIDFRLEAIER